MEKLATCCFTGHRKLTLQQTCFAYEKTKEIIKELISSEYKNFCCGGALGYDTVAANVVIELREQYDIKLVLILPCENQDMYFTPQQRAVYNEIKQKADKVIYTEQEYKRGCMHKRNRALVDVSSVCVCCSIYEKGGTAYTIDYAHKKGLKVINLFGGEE